jgi:hypothetical protein
MKKLLTLVLTFCIMLSAFEHEAKAHTSVIF